MSEELYREIGEKMANESGTVASQMFGKPCLKSSNKAFAAFFQDAMVFKLGRDEISLLASKYPGAVNFDPSGKGRPMKDWLQVPFDFKEDWEGLANQALLFVSGTK